MRSGAALLKTVDALKRAITLQNAGDLAGAERLCKGVLQREPRNPDALNLLGAVALRRGDAAQAERLIAKAIGIRPQGASYHHNLGQALAAQSRLDAAVEAYRRAVALAPADPARHEALAVALKANKQMDEAAAVLRQAIALDPKRAKAHVALGDVLQDRGDVAEACACYREAVALDPDNPSAHNNLAAALQKHGDLPAAVAAYRRAIDRNPGSALFHINLGVALFMQGDLRGALDAFEQCLALDPFDRRGIAYRSIARAALGLTDPAAEQAELDASLHGIRLETPPGYRSMAEFNAALARDLLAHRSLRWEPAGTATTGGADILLLLQHPTKTIRAFERVLRAAVDRYFRSLTPEPGHPFLDFVPKTYDLDIWGTVLKSQGHQAAHIHPTGWMSGVYYVQLPESLGSGGHNRDYSGWIEFGRPSDNFGIRHEPAVRLMQPEEGVAFFFPSYVYHRTVPFEGDKERISIAFDVRPKDVRRAEKEAGPQRS